jgi:hypothetical protein
MPKTAGPVVLTARVQQLLDERAKLEAGIAGIDQILGKIHSALGTTLTAAPRRGRPPKAATAAAPTGVKRGRRKGKKFKVTAEESILGFIKQHKNPTTQEINKHWKAEGRGATADNTLSKMSRDGHIKREPLEGTRGSRYLLA